MNSLVDTRDKVAMPAPAPPLPVRNQRRPVAEFTVVSTAASRRVTVIPKERSD